eukprot:jgi/Chlat1/8302/Chrsp78S07737
MPKGAGAFPIICAETNLPFVTNRMKSGYIFVVSDPGQGYLLAPPPFTYNIGNPNDLEKQLRAWYPLETRAADRNVTVDLTADLLCDPTNQTTCTRETPFLVFSFDRNTLHLPPDGNGAEDYNFQAPFSPNPDPIRVQLNERVCIEFLNRAPGDHVLHMHGHHFQVMEINHVPITGGGAMHDTIYIMDSNLDEFFPKGPGFGDYVATLPDEELGQLKICFDADNPGIWALHCHYNLHYTAGMLTTVEYAASDVQPSQRTGCQDPNAGNFVPGATAPGRLPCFYFWCPGKANNKQTKATFSHVIACAYVFAYTMWSLAAPVTTGAAVAMFNLQIVGVTLKQYASLGGPSVVAR